MTNPFTFSLYSLRFKLQGIHECAPDVLGRRSKEFGAHAKSDATGRSWSFVQHTAMAGAFRLAVCLSVVALLLISVEGAVPSEDHAGMQLMAHLSPSPLDRDCTGIQMMLGWVRI